MKDSVCALEISHKYIKIVFGYAQDNQIIVTFVKKVPLNHAVESGAIRDHTAIVKELSKNNQFIISTFKPELIDNGNISDYDTIYIGTPVWWYTFATPIRTFLAENDFTGKTIMPFCTHGGGGASSTYADMQKLCPNAKVKEGFTSYENTAKVSDIQNWIEK